MRNSAGFSPISLPQFTWPSIDKRRDPVHAESVETSPPESADSLDVGIESHEPSTSENSSIPTAEPSGEESN